MGETSKQLVAEFLDAAVRDQPRARALLADHPELLTAPTLGDETPLHFLVVEGYVDAVRLLVEAGAEIDVVGDSGHTPLLDAAILGNADVAEILLAYGANPNATSHTHDNVLHAAVASGNPQLVDLLLRAGANPRYLTDLEETVFDALPEDPAKREELLQILARHGVTQGAA